MNANYFFTNRIVILFTLISITFTPLINNAQINIITNGYVGVGLPNPQNIFHVNAGPSTGLVYSLKLQGATSTGTSRGTGISFLIGQEGNGGKGGLVYIDDNSGWNKGDFMFLQNTAPNSSGAVIVDAVMTIKNNGRVGIGTISPSFPLSFGTSIGNKIALWDAGSGVGYGFGIQSNLLQIFANSATDRVGIGYGNSTSFTEALTIKGTKVGIGNNNPGVALDVVGNINIGATNAFQINGINELWHNGHPENIFVGWGAGGTNVTGLYNAFMGFYAGRNTTSSIGNCAFGSEALKTNSNSVGYNNAFGYLSLTNNNAAYNNAFGGLALTNNTSGTSNCAMGYGSLYLNITGNNNTAIGHSALYSTGLSSSSSNNTALGYNSGRTNTTGSNNTYIGYGADAAGGGYSNATAIGYNALVASSNSLVLGNGVNVGIGQSSPTALLHFKNGHIRSEQTTAPAIVVTTQNSITAAAIAANATDTKGTITTTGINNGANTIYMTHN